MTIIHATFKFCIQFTSGSSSALKRCNNRIVATSNVITKSLGLTLKLIYNMSGNYKI